jgi:hypothetical protein
MSAPTTPKKDAAEARIAELERQLEEAKARVADAEAKAPIPVTVSTVDQDEEVLDKEPAPTTVNLQQLRKYEGTLYIKNNDPQRAFSCHQAIGQHRVDFDLEPAGCSESVTIMPKLALEVRGLLRAWLRGSITISTDEKLEDEMTLLMNKHVRASQARVDSFMTQLTPSATEKDLVEKACLQCGKRNQFGAIEGGRVFQTLKMIKEGIPPLCDLHTHLAHLFPGTQITTENGQEWMFNSPGR